MTDAATNEPDTSASLLDRLGSQSNRQSEADWNRFVDLYGPLIHHWGQRRSLGASDCQDLVQDVLMTLHRLLPSFRYDPQQRFRGYLHGVTRRAIAQRRRESRHEDAAPGIVDDLADDESADPSFAAEQREYNTYVSRRSLELLRDQFPKKQWQACWLSVVEGRTIPEVCRQLDLSPNQVYLARSRVLARLRVELRDLLD